MNETFLEFKSVLKSRRSVRKFTQEQIPESLVLEWLDLALLAPNSSNLQPWEFYWVHSPDKKQELAKYCFSQSAATTAAELIAVVARPDRWKMGQRLNLEALRATPNPPQMALNYYEKIVPLAYSADPFGVLKILKTIFGFLAGLKGPSYRGPFGESGNLLWATKTCALAAENLMLAIQASGFNSCPMEGFDQSRAKKLLNLPRQAQVVMIIAAGRGASDGVYGPQMRGPTSQFVHRL